jgi:CRP-like cAMP-binding protein
MSALPLIADINPHSLVCLLCAKSGHLTKFDLIDGAVTLKQDEFGEQFSEIAEMTGLFPSNSDTSVATFIEEMCLFCRLQALSPGDQLRVKGQHYRNMYLITHGECDVELDPGGPNTAPVKSGPGEPIGEIGFLRGMPATATVTAREHTQVLVIDDEAIEILESRRPALLAKLLQRLSDIADDRTSYNLVLTDGKKLDTSEPDAKILLCRNAEMLEQAQRLRYEVYCVELGRNSPSANAEKGTIADKLDDLAHCFVAVLNGETVGTIRTNFAKEGSLGSLQELYGMPASPYYPDHCAICTRFIVKRAYRGSPTAMQLISYATQFGLHHDMRECFIDCVPKLLHYFRAMGFQVAGDTFFHPENGPSIPLRLDLEKHGKNLTGDVGIKRMVAFYFKTKALKFVDGMRG